MYSDEGPSEATPFLPMSPTTQPSDVSSIDLQKELTMSPLKTTRKPRKLNLFDKYEIVGDVPTMCLRPGRREHFINSVFSDDGTRMAVVMNDSYIRLYDVFDNYSLIARADPVGGCKYVAFWQSRDDLLMVLTGYRIIHFLSLSLASSFSYGSTHQYKGDVVSMDTVKMIDIGHPDGEKSFSNIQVAHNKNILWILEDRRSQNDTLLLTCMNEDESICQTPIRHVPLIALTRLHLLIPQKAVMVVNGEDVKTATTLLWLDLNYHKKETFTALVKLDGEVMLWSDDGKFLVLRRIDKDKNVLVLELHSIKHIRKGETKHRSRIWSTMDLSFHYMQIEFLRRHKSAFEEIRSDKKKVYPLIAIFLVQSKGSGLLVCDSSTKQVIRELDLTMKEMEFEGDERFTFCISPNMKWLGVYHHGSCTLGLFSFGSGALVWKHKVESKYPMMNSSEVMTFDPLSSKLVLHSKSTILVFMLPCLVQDDRTRYEHFIGSLGSKHDVSISALNALPPVPIPKRILLQLVHFWFFQSLIKAVLDATSSSSPPRIAILVNTNRRLSVFVGDLQELFTSRFKHHLEKALWERSDSSEFQEIAVEEEIEKQFFPTHRSLHVFLYFNNETKDDSIALFSVSDGLHALFIDINDRDKQTLVPFYEGEWFAIIQSNSGLRVTCLGVKKILIIDLNQREALYNVAYHANLLHWIKSICCSHEEMKKYYDQTSRFIGLCSVSDDGKSILVGWDKEKKTSLLLTSSMKDQDVAKLEKNLINNMLCWGLSGDLKKLAFWECDEDNNSLSSLCVINKEDNFIRQIDRKDWNIVQSQGVDEVLVEHKATNTIDLWFNEGCLWIIALQKHSKHGLIILPFSPFVTRIHVPDVRGGKNNQNDISFKDLKELALQSESSFFNMKFEGFSNFQQLHKTKHKEMMLKLIEVAWEQQSSIDLVLKEDSTYGNKENLMDHAIQEQDDSMLAMILDIIGKQLTTFHEAASMMGNHFEKLWLSYRTLIEPLMRENVLCWKVNEVKVPSDIFSLEKRQVARMGTTNTILEWKNVSNEEDLRKLWESFNQTHVEIIKRKGSPTKVTADIKVFCMDGICKVGLNGLLRFLLMRKAPTSLFKVEIVKWVILWKWANIWKRRCRKDLFVYLVFIVALSVYAGCIGHMGRKMHAHLSIALPLTLLLLLMSIFSMLMLFLEYVQLKRYIKDGNKLFPEKHYWGIKYYFRSRWNILDIGTYAMLLTIIPCFHFLCWTDPCFIKYLIAIVAFEVILAWVKIWYYAQAFQTTGPLVLMIENVFKDSFFFLFLAFVILVGFALALFVAFQYHLTIEKRDHDEVQVNNELRGEYDDELYEKFNHSFGNPIKAMLTLFYAMMGTFDPEIYAFNGIVSPVVTIIFVGYLAIQTVVMFNMLIALMGDTFDRVKNTEEEQLLMGRAMFMDSCEASLTDQGISEIEKEIGKYLYVLYPSDFDTSEDTITWQGKVKAVEANVQKLIYSTEDTLSKKILKIENQTTHQFNKFKQELKEYLETGRSDISELQKQLQDSMNKNMEIVLERLDKIEKQLVMQETESINELPTDLPDEEGQ